MEELSERALLRNLHKEQERERRRARDRERRQSMSVEEREKHLARRRRNYQLRRQRAQNAHLDNQFNDRTSLRDRGDPMFMLPSNEHQAFISFPNASNGVASAAAFDQGQESPGAGQTTLVGLEIPAHKLGKLPRRSRLSHIKHLARSLGNPVATAQSPRIATDLIARGTATSDCMPQIGLRLNRVKRLARTLNTDPTAVTDQHWNSQIEVEQSLPSEELHLTGRNGDQLEVFHSDNIQVEDKCLGSDG